MCALCKEKTARIKDLQAALADLRSMVLPRHVEKGVPLVHLEADAVISGQQDQFQSDPQTDEAQDEAARILSGNY
jgi:hypothetical protein